MHTWQTSKHFISASSGTPAFSRISVLPAKNRMRAAARSGACPICAGFHSCARLFSQRRRAGDGHLAGGDAEELPGPVSHAWLEQQQQVRGGGGLRWWGAGLHPYTSLPPIEEEGSYNKLNVCPLHLYCSPEGPRGGGGGVLVFWSYYRGVR